MEFTTSIWIVLLVVVFVLGLILGDRTKLARRLIASVQSTVGQTKVIETMEVPESGGTIQFIDQSNQIDLTVTVPRQANARPMTFQRLVPAKDLPNPTDKKIFTNFMGLKVTDKNGDVTFFDPAITIKRKYSEELLKEYMDKFKITKDLSDLILLFHDGEGWRRLPIVDRSAEARTLTALIGSFVHSDNLADGG